jgi:hypothetical protein
VERSASLNPAGKPLAVEAWVKADKPGGVVVANGGPAHGYALYVQEGRPRFAVRVKEEPAIVSATRKIVGQWVHLAGVLSVDKQLQLYVDGELAASAAAPGFIAGEPVQAIEIGADEGSGEGVGKYNSPLPLTGVIDQVRLYDGPVTAAEIKSHFDDPGDKTVADAKLVLDFTFDKGKARDLSGNNNHGKAPGVKPVSGKLGQAMQLTGRTGSGTRGHFVEYHWSVENPPLFARAMVLADKTLFVAGPPDFVNEDEVAAGNIADPALLEQLAAQDAAMNGEKGGILLAVSAADGQTISRRKLANLPTWDGMVAARGCLYISTEDGKVLCLKGR